MSRKYFQYFQYEMAKFWYRQIIDQFGFDEAEDTRARDLLCGYREKHGIENITDKLTARIKECSDFYFFGAGPNLEAELRAIQSNLRENRSQYFLTAADGASLALEEAGIIPDLITSDLDGLTVENITFFLDNGAILAIHGHGDNLDLIHNARDMLIKSPNIICTTQVDAKNPVINPGGFTDGDRGLFLAHHLTPPAIAFHLIGYSFGGTVGKYSKPAYAADMPITPVKALKLDFARRLLDHLSSDLGRELIFFSRAGE